MGGVLSEGCWWVLWRTAAGCCGGLLVGVRVPEQELLSSGGPRALHQAGSYLALWRLPPLLCRRYCATLPADAFMASAAQRLGAAWGQGPVVLLLCARVVLQDSLLCGFLMML